MKTLLLPARYSEDSIRLRGAAIEAGYRVERLQFWRAPEHLQGAPVVLYGEPLFAAALAGGLGLALIEPTPSLLSTLPDEFLKRKLDFTYPGSARAWPVRAFIKPADEKSFPVAIYENGKELPRRAGVPDSTPVLISEPVEWEVEYRCFVANRTAAALSPYLRNGELACDEKGEWPASEEEKASALEFVERVLGEQSLKLPPAVVLDVGRIRGRGWAVIEFNAAFCSGLYGCDPASVLKVVEHCILREREIPEEAKEWVLTRNYG